jgi:ABC-2 type transport system ATP-binding protein
MSAHSPAIQVRRLAKHNGNTVVVDDLTFDVHPGQITGFSGPNDADKSTALRMILGLDEPTSGSALVHGQSFASRRRPLLDPKSFHPVRSARNHLRVLAVANGIDQTPVDAVLDVVGSTSVASERAVGFSLGMGQRLGIPPALLGNRSIQILDEPINGLDPYGNQWIRTLLRSLAPEGCTVPVFSHLMSEMALTTDHMVVIGQARLFADGTVDPFVAVNGPNNVHVRSPESERLAVLQGASETAPAPGELDVTAQCSGPCHQPQNTGLSGGERPVGVSGRVSAATFPVQAAGITSTATSTSTPSRNRAVSARSPPGLGIDVGEEGRQGQLGVLVVAFGHSGPGSTLSRTRYAPTACIESGVDVTQVRTRLAFAPGDRLRSRGPTS